jgi:ferrous iron transport protein B
MDWKFGVAILASFVAREVFVGTLGTLFGIESASENVESLAHALRSSGLSLASGLSLLVFYAIALQCASTLSVMRRETGGWKIPLYTFVSYSLLAYTLAALTYLLTRTLSGFSL